jgi:hypothetical protein
VKILVQINKTTGNLPAGAAFADTVVTVTDDLNASQEVTLNGSESPPWSHVFDVADGHGGSVSAKDFDTNGNDITVGGPFAETYDSAGTGGGTAGDTFAATSGMSITPVAP